MLASKRDMVLINVFGGVAVLGSYAYTLMTYPERAADFWGGVPEALRPLYTVNMFLAAAGYFAFTFFILFRMAPAPDGGHDFGVGRFNALYGLILIPSAMWMPLTFAMLESPSPALWWAIRLTLTTVAIGSVGLVAGLVAARPASATLAHRAALVGSLAFCVQTLILDAVIWPAFFPA